MDALEYDDKNFEIDTELDRKPVQRFQNWSNVLTSYHETFSLLQDFEIDMFLRQFWNDTRLRFNGSGYATLSHSKLRAIWWPDTFFYNAKGGFVHRITFPNEQVRILPDGRINVAQR